MMATIYSHYEETYTTALSLFIELTTAKPEDLNIQLELATLYVNLKDFSSAISIVNSISIQEHEVSLQIQLATLQEKLGYAWASRKRFNTLLSQHPKSTEIKFAYAYALLSWGSFYEAEKIYKEIKPINEKEAKEQFLGILDTIIGEGRLFEAIGCIEETLNTCLDYQEELLLRLVNIKQIQNEYETALETIETLLTIAKKPRDYLSIKESILYYLERYEESLSVSLTIISKTNRASAFIGAGKNYLALGMSKEANSYFIAAQSYPQTEIEASFYLSYPCQNNAEYIQSIIDRSKTAQEIANWARLYAEWGNTTALTALYYAGVKKDGNYLPAAVGLAEAFSAELQYKKARNQYLKIINTMPLNSKLLLEYARNFSWDRMYSEAIDAYQVIIDLNPGDPVPRLEQARIAYWGRKYTYSMERYEELVFLMKNSNLLKNNLKNLFLEIAFRKADWKFERFKKWDIALELLLLEPGSSQWRFEFAQSLCSFNYCEKSIEWYNSIIHDHPLETLIFLEKKRVLQKEHNGCNLSYNYWKERGYGELAQIARYEEIFSVEIPFSCTNTLVISQHFWDEHTFFDHHFHPAQGVSGTWKYQFNRFFSFEAATQYKNYLGHFKPTVTGFGMLNINFFDYANCSLGFTRRDEIFNYFNLKQKTQGSVWSISLHSQLTHHISLDYLFEDTHYSDDNNGVFSQLQLQINLTEFPKTLRLVATGVYRNTAKTNQFIYNTASMIDDIIYPYWAPQDYFMTQILLGFRHDYGNFQSCASPQRFYDLSVYCGDDTQNNPFWAIRAQWVHECFYHWRFSISGLIHRSPMWKANGLWGSVSYKF